MNRILLAGCFVVGVCLCAAGAAAQTSVSGSNGNWSSASTWTPAVVPNNGGGKTYDVNILNNSSNPNASVTLYMDATIDSLSVVSGGNLGLYSGTLTTGSLSNAGNILDQSSLTVTGNTNSSGTLEVSANGMLATFTATGNVGNSGSVTLGVNGVLHVDGVFTNQATASLNIETISNFTNYVGSLNNAGLLDLSFVSLGTALNVAGNVDNTGSFASNGGTLNVGGSFINESGGTLQLLSQDRFGLNELVNAGTVYVAGEFQTLNNGLIAEGSLLTVGMGTPTLSEYYQGYQQFANGKLDEVVKGLTSFGVIDMNAEADVLLDGTLDVTLANGFTPTIGETFDIMNFGPGRLGGKWTDIENDIFDNGAEEWVVDYDQSGGEILLEAEAYIPPAPTPEPGSIVLLGTGLMGLWYFGRRKMRRSAA